MFPVALPVATTLSILVLGLFVGLIALAAVSDELDRRGGLPPGVPVLLSEGLGLGAIAVGIKG